MIWWINRDGPVRALVLDFCEVILFDTDSLLVDSYLSAFLNIDPETGCLTHTWPHRPEALRESKLAPGPNRCHPVMKSQECRRQCQCGLSTLKALLMDYFICFILKQWCWKFLLVQMEVWTLNFGCCLGKILECNINTHRLSTWPVNGKDQSRFKSLHSPIQTRPVLGRMQSSLAKDVILSRLLFCVCNIDEDGCIKKDTGNLRKKTW